MWHHTFLSTICTPLEINAPYPTQAEAYPSLIPLLARDNTSDTTSRINDIIMGGYANVGTTNLNSQPIKPSKRAVILGYCYA